MEITCLQMDVLISFYIDGDLSSSLKEKVEEHIRKCPTCRAKYNIISSLFFDVKKSLESEQNEFTTAGAYHAKQYNAFSTNLSAYVDNELPQEESIKIKKYTINNKKARKDLEDIYKIRKLMKSSFKKTDNESKSDFSKKILKQLDLYDSQNLAFNPLIKVAGLFVITVLIISAIVVYFMI